MWMNLMYIKGLFLEKISDACPEQYYIYRIDKDVFTGRFGYPFHQKERVAYIRYRWGRFSVTCPDEKGETMLLIVNKEVYGGTMTPKQRKRLLKQAVRAIYCYLQREVDWQTSTKNYLPDQIF